jgi:hypothetical protein
MRSMEAGEQGERIFEGPKADRVSSGVPNVIGRFRGQPAPDGPLLDSRKGTWVLNESHDPPTFDVTIPADESSGKEAVRRQFLYRLTGKSDGVLKLELACILVDPVRQASLFESCGAFLHLLK